MLLLLTKATITNSIELHFNLQNNRLIKLNQLKLTNQLLIFKSFNINYLNANNLINYDTTLYNDNPNLPSSYKHLKVIPFIDFFKLNLIDVPLCFKKSYSLRRGKKKNDILTFTNYLFRSGLKLKVLNVVINALFSIKNDFYTNTSNFNWKSLYITFFNFNFSSLKNYNYFNQTKNFDSLYENLENQNYSILKKNIKSLEPIFLLYIYKVDKSIFKNSRGKSGKFTFI